MSNMENENQKQGQNRFLEFIMERVASGNEEVAKGLLSDSFYRMDQGKLTKEYLEEFMPKLLLLLKEEYIEEVTRIMVDFNSRNVN